MEAEDLWFMKMALAEAERAYEEDEVPVGAVLVNSFGDIIGKGHNLKERDNNPCGHAEILTLLEASSTAKNWRLIDTKLYVTLEPCIMCFGALIHARVKKVVFGAYDKKAGALSLGYLFNQDKRLNHKFDVLGGAMHYECSRILSQFFREKRSGYKQDFGQ